MGESELLVDAKMYEKRRQWGKARDHYRRYLTHRGYSSNSTTYLAYARCLRHTGETFTAKRILDELLRVRSRDEAVLLEESALHESRMDWVAAEESVQKLVRVRPEKAKYHFRLGRAQVGANNLESARQSYMVGLARTHATGLDDIIRQVQNTLPESSGQVRSTYSLPGGFDNLGALVHETGSNRYFTKIVRLGKDRDHLFYTGLLNEHDQLRIISPQYHGSQEIDGLCYLTIGMLDALSAQPEFADIIEISRTIQSVRYGDVGQQYGNAATQFELKLNTPSVVKTFTRIHEKGYNDRLFETLHHLAVAAYDAEPAERIISKLEQNIMGNHLYALISPAEHYTLLHGDLKPSNIMIDKSTAELRVVDWQGFRMGPRFLDIAKYAVHAKLSYATVAHEYLFAEDDGDLSTIEQIFFLYAYILMVLLTSMRKPLNTGLAVYIDPALVHMDACIAQLKSQQFAPALGIVAEKMQRLETQLAQQTAESEQASRDARHMSAKVDELKRAKSSLDTRNRRLANRLKAVEQSTSWRWTAPVRAAAGTARRIARTARTRREARRRW